MNEIAANLSGRSLTRRLAGTSLRGHGEFIDRVREEAAYLV
jgi:hypothetical protein